MFLWTAFSLTSQPGSLQLRGEITQTHSLISSGIPDTLPPVLKDSTLVGSLNSSHTISITVVLSENMATADDYLRSISNTQSSLYHRFLTPTQFYGMFGPNSLSISLVREWLSAEGITNISSSFYGQLTFVANVSEIDVLFCVSLNVYSYSGELY